MHILIYPRFGSMSVEMARFGNKSSLIKKYRALYRGDSISGSSLMTILDYCTRNNNFNSIKYELTETVRVRSMILQEKQFHFIFMQILMTKIKNEAASHSYKSVEIRCNFRIIIN